jgi:hypothetical protein
VRSRFHPRCWQVRHRPQSLHTYATLLLAAGADWTYIADQMGHKNLTMLQKHYLRWKQGKPKGPGLDVMADALGFAAVVKRAVWLLKTRSTQKSNTLIRA